MQGSTEPDDLYGTHYVHSSQFIKAAAFGSNGAWYVCKAGGRAVGYWSADLPQKLQEELTSKHDPSSAQPLPCVSYLALNTDPKADSSKEVWFVRYEDGSYKWGADVPARMQELLADKGNDVEAVCFGPDSAYVVVLEDGGTYCSNLPEHVQRIVEAGRNKHGGLLFAALGPNGECSVYMQML